MTRYPAACCGEVHSKMKKVIIQCCATKRADAQTFIMQDGKRVKFVADPTHCPSQDEVVYYHPDDINPDTGTTWRDFLLEYNYNCARQNPSNLYAAKDLYEPGIYGDLAKDDRWEMYILSAGWGLVKADFLLPAYDITFANNKNGDKCKKRNFKEGNFNDYNQLTAQGDDVLYFFGGKDYLPLYYELTRELTGKKVTYCKAAKISKEHGYEYIEYETTQRTNWHYNCARDFIRGKISQ